MERRTFLKSILVLPLLAVFPNRVFSATPSKPQVLMELKEGTMSPFQIRQGELVNEKGQYGMWCEVNPLLKVSDIKVIHKQAGSSGTIDPLMQDQTVGFKFRVNK